MVYNFEGCGWGGSASRDGNNAVVVPNGNCRNTPVEVFDSRYPWRTISYELVQDSAGPGRYRGGLGIRRVLEVVEPAKITVSAVFERVSVNPWGLFGGGSGGNAAVLVKKKGDDTFKTFSEVYGTVSAAKFANCVVEAGDQVLIESPGGGGFGPTPEREVNRVLDDVSQGFISAQAARDLYGVGVERVDGRLAVDRQETARLRGR